MKILKKLLDLLLCKPHLVENSLNVAERVELLMKEGMYLEEATYVADMEEGFINDKK